MFFLQVLQPIRLLPWPAFMAVWAAILMAALVYLTGPRLILLGLAFFGLMEIWGGNIEMLVALAIVLGFRWPATWSFVLLTKVTPGLGLLWFLVRREPSIGPGPRRIFATLAALGILLGGVKLAQNYLAVCSR